MIFPIDKHIFSTFFSSFSHPFSPIICQKWICPSGDCHRRCRRWPSRRSWASAQLQQFFFRWTDFEIRKHARWIQIKKIRWIQMVKCRLLIQIRRYLCKFPVIKQVLSTIVWLEKSIRSSAELRMWKGMWRNMENHGSEPLPSKVDRKRWNNL